MGMDTVELVVSTEQAFGVCISDEEASGVSKVGQLVDLIEAKLAVLAAQVDLGICPCQRAFYELRSKILPLSKGSRASFRLSTTLNSLGRFWTRPKLKRLLETDFQIYFWPTLCQSWNHKTVRDLATFIAQRRRFCLVVKRPEIEDKLWGILGEMGYPRAAYSLESHFIKDLGMD